MSDERKSRDQDGARPEEQEDAATERRSFGDVMQAIFLPMLPALIGAGILQGITSVIVAIGLLGEGSPLHTVLSTISAAIFYFLPFLLAASTAKAFGTSPYLAIGVVAFFLYPEMVALMESTREISLLGIPIVKTTYTSSVIPIILMIWGMSYVHRWTLRITPAILQVVFVPPVTIAITCVVGVLALGPVGAVLTEAIAWVISSLYANAQWLIPLVVGGLGPVLVTVGLSFTLFPFALTSISELGYDGVYGPGILGNTMALAGMSLAVALKAKDRDYRAFSLTASATAALGVAQPALFGNAIALRRPFVATMVGAASGGLVAGLTGFKVYALVPPGLPAIPAYVGDSGWGNLGLAAAVMATAFVVAFVATWLLGYEQPDQAAVEDITGEKPA